MKFNFFKSSRCFNKAKTQKGFTLIELIIALAVIGTAVGGILVFQSTAEGRQKVVSTTSGVNLMVGKIRSVYGSTGSYTSATSANLISGGFIEAPFKVSGTNIVDTWGNNVTFAVGPTSAARYFGFIVTPPTPDACIALANALLPLADRMTIDLAAPTFATAAIVNTIGTFHPGTGTIVVKSGPGAVASTANMVSACNGATSVIAMSFV